MLPSMSRQQNNCIDGARLQSPRGHLEIINPDTLVQIAGFDANYLPSATAKFGINVAIIWFFYSP
jgi:hypothetical protein